MSRQFKRICQQEFMLPVKRLADITELDSKLQSLEMIRCLVSCMVVVSVICQPYSFFTSQIGYLTCKYSAVKTPGMAITNIFKAVFDDCLAGSVHWKRTIRSQMFPLRGNVNIICAFIRQFLFICNSFGILLQHFSCCLQLHSTTLKN